MSKKQTGTHFDMNRPICDQLHEQLYFRLHDQLWVQLTWPMMHRLEDRIRWPIMSQLHKELNV